MGDENPICTLRDYFKPSHEGYMNTIELLVGNNVVPLRSDTIRLVQNECSFQEHRSEDPNQHFKDFLKLVDSLDLDGRKKERNDNDYMAADGGINETDTKMPVNEAEKETEAEKGTKNKPIKRAKREETTEASSSQPVGYYQKHRINEKLTKGLVNNHRFNDSLSGIRVGKVKGKTYNLSPRGPVYEAILKKNNKVANTIRTLGDYSKPRHEDYKNTIELLVENNVVPLRSDTIQLVQNGCSFHGHRSEDPNQHLKDLLKLEDSLDHDVENREKTRLRLFQFSLRDQSSNWLERLPTGSYEIDLYGDSWEIVKNLALYDHEGWNDSKEFVKLVKGISTPQSTSKTPDQRLLELEDQINFLLKGSRSTPRPSSTHIPQAYAEEDYMATHTKKMERFENAIFKQREEINDKMAKMFRLLKELTTSRALKKVLIKEEAKSPVTKNINSVSLARGKEERKDNDYMVADGGINEIDTKMPVKEAEKDTEAENGTKNRPIKRAEASSSQPIGYYQKHMINEKLIKGLIDNHRFNDSLSRIRVRKVKGKTYNLLPRGPVYEAILRKMITRREDIGGNFEIPYNIVGLKHMNALVDQGSDVNVMPLST
nr:MAK10-like protein [Tanacetum cinerariifolium]